MKLHPSRNTTDHNGVMQCDRLNTLTEAAFALVGDRRRALLESDEANAVLVSSASHRADRVIVNTGDGWVT